MKRQRRNFVKISNRKRKVLYYSLFFLLFCIGIGYSVLNTQLTIGGNLEVHRYEPHTLYYVLKNGLGVDTVQFTGGHGDSMDPSKSTKNVYSYRNTSDVVDKNNVLFGGYCWQIVRTTDTGGVKLIYNGLAENNQCLNTREQHVGYNGYSRTSLSSSIYYGTDYTYDSSTSKFSLSGDISVGTWNSTTADSLSGLYTCNSRTETATCSTLYYTYAFLPKLTEYQTENAYVLLLNGSANYNNIGKLPLNMNPSQNGHSLANVSYMFKDYYPANSKRISSSKTFLNSIYFSISTNPITLSEDSWISDDVSYSSRYSMISPYHVSTNVDKSTLIGKYITDTTSTTYLYQIYYIVGYNNSTLYTYRFDSSSLNIHLPSDLEPFYIADSYVDNGDNTYTLSNPVSVSLSDWYNNRTTYNEKYMCENHKDTTCSTVHNVISATTDSYYYLDDHATYFLSKTRNGLVLTNPIEVRHRELYDNPSGYNDYTFFCKSGKSTCDDNSDFAYFRGLSKHGTNILYLDWVDNYPFGQSVSWDGEKYTLNNTVGVENFTQKSVIANHHYICDVPGVTQCENVYYIYYSTGGESLLVFLLSGGKTSVNDVINDTLKNNEKDSVSKAGIDAWFEKYFMDYNSYLENVIFINSRDISTMGGLEPNSYSANSISTAIQFVSYGSSEPSKILYTAVNTDKFSVDNDNAKLTYSVALPSYTELSLLPSLERDESIYLLTMTPVDYNDGERIVYMNTSSRYNTSYSMGYIRPLIALKPEVEYSTGDGSRQNPYVIVTE